MSSDTLIEINGIEFTEARHIYTYLRNRGVHADLRQHQVTFGHNVVLSLPPPIAFVVRALRSTCESLAAARHNEMERLPLGALVELFFTVCPPDAVDSAERMQADVAVFVSETLLILADALAGTAIRINPALPDTMHWRPARLGKWP